MTSRQWCVSQRARIEEEENVRLRIFKKATDPVPLELCAVFSGVTEQCHQSLELAREAANRPRQQPTIYHVPCPVKLVIRADITIAGVIYNEEMIWSGILQEGCH